MISPELRSLLDQAISLSNLLPEDAPSQAKQTALRLVLEAFELGARETAESFTAPRAERCWADDGRRVL